MQLAAFAFILVAGFALYPAECGFMGLPTAPLGAVVGDLTGWLAVKTGSSASARDASP